MPQIALVADQHNDNIGISMISELLQPSSNVFISLVFADIVDKQRTNGTAIISRCDCSISFLPSSIPDLCFDCL